MTYPQSCSTLTLAPQGVCCLLLQAERGREMKDFQTSPVLWIILQIRIHRSLPRCRSYAPCKERRSCSALMPREHIPWGDSGVKRENKGPPLSKKRWIVSIPVGRRATYISLKVEKGGWRGGGVSCLKEQRVWGPIREGVWGTWAVWGQRGLD